jgi:predicted transglutaminase-like cysteine proteinase
MLLSSLQKNKKAILKRIKNYKKIKKNLLINKKNFSNYKMLSRVNSFFNNILSKYDKQTTGNDDNWALPKEFLIRGFGDCEDYAIAKYFCLKEIKFNPKKLYLMVVKVKGSKTMHMILGYFETSSSVPYILDNLSFKVVPLSKRKDLSVKFAFNEFGSYLLKNNRLYKKVKINWGKQDKWQHLLDKMYSSKNTNH